MQWDYGVCVDIEHRGTLKNANVVKHIWRQAIKVQLFGNVFQDHLDLLCLEYKPDEALFNTNRPMENWQLFFTFTLV